MDFHNKRFIGAIQAEINPLRHKVLCLRVEKFQGERDESDNPLVPLSSAS